jgi:hypothetical protein
VAPLSHSSPVVLHHLLRATARRGGRHRRRRGGWRWRGWAWRQAATLAVLDGLLACIGAAGVHVVPVHGVAQVVVLTASTQRPGSCVTVQKAGRLAVGTTVCMQGYRHLKTLYQLVYCLQLARRKIQQMAFCETCVLLTWFGSQ